MTKSPTIFAVSFLALAAACGGEGGVASTATVRDSAGIAIVENSAHGWREGTGWRISAEPVVSIGALEGDTNYQLHQVVAAYRLSDGRIAIFNAGSQQVRFYDTTGRFIASSGRKGGGPGEFEQAYSMFAVGDSLYIFDSSLRRLSVVAPTGAFVRAVTLASPSEGGFPSPVGVLDDGSVIVAARRSFMFGTVTTGTYRDSMHVLRYAASGEPLDTIGKFQGSESFVFATDNMMMVTGLPFGRSTTVLARGDRVVVGVSDSYELHVFRVPAQEHLTIREGAATEQTMEEARPERIIRRGHVPLQVTQGDIDEMKRRRLEGVTSPQGRENIERQWAAMTFPRTMGAYGLVRLGTDGLLWVDATRRPHDEVPRWSVFDQDGRLLGDLVLPERFGILDAGDDYVLGRWRDDLDVEYVQMYRLIKDGREVAEAR